MCYKGLLFAAVLAACVLIGCEKDVREAQAPPAAAPSSSATSATVATLPAERVIASPDVESATVAATTAPAQPPVAFLLLDGLAAQFPPTNVRLHLEDGQTRAELFSDLPKSALGNYAGNEIYLEMDLTTTLAGQIDGATWRFKARTSDKADSPNGIFLAGQTRHLQPNDVLIKFEKSMEPREQGVKGGQVGQLTAHLMGQFRAFERGTPDAFAPFVAVNGSLTVEVASEK